MSTFKNRFLTAVALIATTVAALAPGSAPSVHAQRCVQFDEWHQCIAPHVHRDNEGVPYRSGENFISCAAQEIMVPPCR